MLPTVSASFYRLYVFCVRGKVPLKQGVNYFCPFAKTVILTTNDTLAKAVDPSSLNFDSKMVQQCNKLEQIVLSTKTPKFGVSLIRVSLSELEK